MGKKQEKPEGFWPSSFTSADRNLLTAIVAKLDKLQKSVDTLQKSSDTLTSLEKTEMASVNDVKAAVTKETGVVQSAVTLLQQLTALVQANINDPVALQQVVDQINADTDGLASAVQANTPAAP